MTIAILLLIGFAAGISSGVLGIGGGILIVPLLVGVLGFAQKKAQGTSLVALLAPVGLFALLEYRAAGEIDMKAGALIALGFFFGGYLGARFVVGLPDDVVRKIFAGVLAAVAVYLFLKK